MKIGFLTGFGSFLAGDRKGLFLDLDLQLVCEKPATASVIRYAFSPVRSIL